MVRWTNLVFVLQVISGSLHADAECQAGPWRVGIELGLTRFWGASEAVSPNDNPALRPYRPTTFGLRLDRVVGRARVGVGVSYATPGLGQEGEDLAIIAKGGLDWVRVTPEVLYGLGRVGPAAQLGVFAGPLLDIWLPNGADSRLRLGGQGGFELLVPLGGALAGAVRAHGGVSGSVFRDPELPDGFRATSMPAAGISLGLRLGF